MVLAYSQIFYLLTLECHDQHDDWRRDWLIARKAFQKERDEKEAKWCQDISMSNMQRKL